MATIADKITDIKALTGYVKGSVILKRGDKNGCTYKWIKDISGIGTRQECFMELDPTEDETKDWLDRTVENDIMLDEAI